MTRRYGPAPPSGDCPGEIGEHDVELWHVGAARRLHPFLDELHQVVGLGAGRPRLRSVRAFVHVLVSGVRSSCAASRTSR